MQRLIVESNQLKKKKKKKKKKRKMFFTVNCALIKNLMTKQVRVIGSVNKSNIPSLNIVRK